MSTSEAGPSTAGPSANSSAPEHHLPATHFYAVEFPGNVKEGSIPRAIQHLGGQARLNRAFKRNASKVDSLLELNWRPENPFSHPIPGPVVNTDSILVKVTKKRLKRKDGSGGEFQGEMVAEAIGIVPKTARFRSMADFQYQPDMSDPMAQLRLAMDRMDVTTIKDFRLQDFKEDFGLSAIEDRFPVESTTGLPTQPPIHSPLRLIPPPVFSRQIVPHIYNYKANSMSIATTIVDSETNTEKKRLINKMRWKGYGPHTISFSEKKVPDLAPPNVLADKELADKSILQKLEKLADERPIWTRTALFNMLNPSDVREIVNSKIILPLLFYAFVDGPWRDTVVKLGYDPRTDPAARFYQRLYFRDANHPVVRPSVVDRRQEQRNLSEKSAIVAASAEPSGPVEGPPSHIFDGVNTNAETAAFQLCDVIDPMLKEMIEDEDGVRDECNERDGWYTTHTLERIKDVLRYKFFSLREGYTPSREECEALLDPDKRAPVKIHDRRRFQPRKHNMAKGALAPEDVAAARLRAALDSSARAASSRGR